jgi:hypothetical protein
MNKDFDNGIEFNSLEHSLKSLSEEIMLGIGKNDDVVREHLRGKIKDLFQKYLNIGMEYHVDPLKFKEAEKLYYLSMGLEYPPESKPNPEIGF